MLNSTKNKKQEVKSRFLSWKKQLQKKLYAFIVTAMMFSVSANAQIVYMDVNPDSTMNCAGNCTLNYNLDLNNDANNDFILKAQHVQFGTGLNASWVSASPLNGNAIKDTLVNSDSVSIPLQFNAVIDSNLLLQQTWQTSGFSYLKFNNNTSGQGLWNNLSDYYLGLRLLQSGQTYYGWVRLRVDVTSFYASVIIRDFAYNTIPNQPILAGQTTATGITENSFASSINLFPNPVTNHLTIALGSNNQKVRVRPGESVLWRITITDITGKIIYSTTATETQKIEVNTKDFAEGIYVVQIQAAGFIGTKKLVIEK